MEKYRNFQGEIRKLQKANEFIFEVEVWLVNNLVNRNGWQYTDMRGNKDQFLGTPILIAYVNNGQTIGDGHNFQMEFDEQGNEAPTFTADTAERIIGAFSEKSSDIRIETTEDGTEWIVGKGFIWKWYAKEAVEKIENDTKNGRPMSISIETLVTQSHMDGEVEVEDEYKILGTTILGDGVAPAVADARVVALNELASEFKELKLRAASYIENSDDESDEDDEGEVDEEEKEYEDEPEPEDESDETKPQNKSCKGVNTLSKLSKKQLAELSAKFEGYTAVVGVRDDNGVHVGLMSEDGTTAIYTMGSLDEVVVPEKIQKHNAQLMYDFGKGCEACVDSGDATDLMVSELIKVKGLLAKKEAEAKELSETIQSMTDREMNRRVSAAKEVATDTLEKFNECREEKVDAELIKDLCVCIDNGDFSALEDKDGQWIGDTEVRNKVLAICATKVMELDKAKAKANSSEYIWSGIKEDEIHDSGDVPSLLASFGVN